MIKDVEIKELARHKDARGFFCEILRKSDVFFANRFGQLSHSLSHEGVLKAWHLHRKQTDWMYVALGDIVLALYDLREDSPTRGELMEIRMGERFGAKVVKIPAGVAHGYKVISGPMHIVYVTDREYDPTDEFRIPADDKDIGYDWDAE